jgi:GxxExxY protein
LSEKLEVMDSGYTKMLRLRGGAALEIFPVRKSIGAQAGGAIGERSGSDCERGANRFSGKISSAAGPFSTRGGQVLHTFFLAAEKESVGRLRCHAFSRRVKNFQGLCFTQILALPEFRSKGVPFEREKAFEIHYKGIILPHKFYADFVVYRGIILEVNACEGIVEEHITQTLNYIAIARSKLGILVNFGSDSLEHKRVVF